MESIGLSAGGLGRKDLAREQNKDEVNCGGSRAEEEGGEEVRKYDEAIKK